MTPDQLPAEARIKFTAIEQQAADAQALMHATLHRLHVTEGKLLMAQQVLDTKPTEPRKQQAETELASAQEEMQQLRAQQDARMQRHAALAQVVTRLKTFLQNLPADAALAGGKAKAPQLPDGESLTTAIQRLRTDIATAQHKLLEIQAAPLPLVDIKAKVAAFVQELAQRGTPTISIERGQFTASWWGWQPGQPAMVGPMQLLQLAAWLDPEKFTERLLAAVKALPNAKLALTAPEKQRRTEELTTNIEQLERQEENLVEQALASGMDVMRRPQANPLAILNVTVAAAKAVAA